MIDKQSKKADDFYKIDLFEDDEIGKSIMQQKNRAYLLKVSVCIKTLKPCQIATQVNFKMVFGIKHLNDWFSSTK